MPRFFQIAIIGICIVNLMTPFSHAYFHTLYVFPSVIQNNTLADIMKNWSGWYNRETTN